MATPLLSLPRGWRAGQVVPSSAARLEAPAERLAAKYQAVHGFGGGQQVHFIFCSRLPPSSFFPGLTGICMRVFLCQ